MTDEDLIKRLLNSRRAMEECRRHPGRTAGDLGDELAVAETEISILREYQRDFPDRREHIDGIIAGWMEAQGKIRAKMH
jgi:hypothetical protein